LSEYLSSCYHFGGATVNIDIDGARCAYEFAAINSANTIIGRPTNIEDTRTAWQNMIKGNITTSKGSGNSITIDNESLLVIGSSYLEFESGAQDLVLSSTTTKQNIFDAVKLTTAPENTTIIAYLGADTALSVGTSRAALTQGVTITVDGINLSRTYGNNCDLNNALPSLRTAAHAEKNSTALIVLDLITIFDAVVNAVDVNENVTVTLEFGNLGA
jgi:hypothetical protein